MSEQRDFFRTRERDYWAGADGLKDEEEALIDRFLDPGLATLDAGTGGGRIPRALVDRGFSSVAGFDFAPELIEAARAAGPPQIDYTVADATSLPYEESSFEQVTYLQQIVSTIDDRDGRRAALAEAARVLAPGGIALFSFVCLESRLASAPERAYVAYLRALRRLRRDPRPIQSMPRLRLSGRLAPGSLRDRGPYVWWYRAAEAEREVRSAGFAVQAVALGPHVLSGQLCQSAERAVRAASTGTLYFACRRV